MPPGSGGDHMFQLPGHCSRVLPASISPSQCAPQGSPEEGGEALPGVRAIGAEWALPRSRAQTLRLPGDHPPTALSSGDQHPEVSCPHWRPDSTCWPRGSCLCLESSFWATRRVHPHGTGRWSQAPCLLQMAALCSPRQQTANCLLSEELSYSLCRDVWGPSLGEGAFQSVLPWFLSEPSLPKGKIQSVFVSRSNTLISVWFFFILNLPCLTHSVVSLS